MTTFSVVVPEVPGLTVSLAPSRSLICSFDVILSYDIPASFTTMDRCGHYMLSQMSKDRREPLMFVSDGHGLRLREAVTHVISDWKAAAVPGISGVSVVPDVVRAVNVLVDAHVGEILTRFAAVLLTLARSEHGAPESGFEDSMKELVAREVHDS